MTFSNKKPATKLVVKSISAIVLSLLFVGVSISSTFAKELRVLSTRPQPELMEVISEKVIPAFEQRYGIKVSFDFATWDERIDKLLISIAAGVPYDIVFTGFYSPLEEGSNHLIAPLDEYLDKWDGFHLYPPGLWETQKWNGHIFRAS